MPPDPPIECTVCKMPLVEGCRNAPDILGGGIIHKIRGEDLVAVTCPNMALIRLRHRLLEIDPRLPAAIHDPNTPLYQRGKFDRTVDNILFKATLWTTLLGHLKWVVGSKDLFIRVATDRALIDVFVGNRSVKYRLRSQLEQGEGGELEITNSIEDLLAAPDLAIIRLGQAVHANRAAANILHEALLLRLGKGKATWLVEPPGRSFVPWSKVDFGIPTGMPCCNDDVLALVKANFDTVHLPPREGDDEAPGYEIDDVIDDATDDVIPVMESGSESTETLPEAGEAHVPRRSQGAPSKPTEEAEIESLMGPKKKWSSKFGKGRF